MHKHGDTLIEVMFAVGIFGLVAISTISLMNRGLNSVQNSLETTMARQEIDAQAETLRFIQSAYLTEPNVTIPATTSSDPPTQTNNFRNLWKAIVKQAYPASITDASGKYTGGVVNEDPDFFTRVVENTSNCNSLFTTKASDGDFGIPEQSFILNPRSLSKLTEIDPSTNQIKVLSDYDIRTYILATAKDTPSPFTTASTYPRLLYGTSATDDDSLSDAYIKDSTLKFKSASSKLESAEGIWITAIASKSGLQCYDADGNPDGGLRPDFYDFYIQTCWDSLNGSASVISSTIRLFNPDQVNLKKQGMITFDNVEWEKYSNTTHSSQTCGAEVCADCHVQANGTEIEFIGYTADLMDGGVRLPIDDRPSFTLDVDVDTTGILTHPGGEGLTISMGPIKANLTDGGGNISSSSKSEAISARQFHLQMIREGDYYKVCIDNICVEDTSNATGVTIDYNFKHNGHCCSAISRAKLSNIEMSGGSMEEDTGSCIKVVTPTL